MNAGVSTWIQKRPVFAFYVLAFAITWLGWVPQAAYSRGVFPFDSPLFYVLGGVGPMLAAFIVLRFMRGEGAYKELFGPLLRWRVGVVWYIVALLGYPAIWLASIALSGQMETELETVGPLLALLPVFSISVLAAIPEEVAWRGFALPRLQARYSALVSALIVGALWGLWHLPLLFNAGNTMSTYPLLPFLLAVVARSVVYVWLYNNTGGSVLIVTIFHAASNTVGTFVPLEALVTGVLAVAIVVLFGPSNLSARGVRAASFNAHPKPREEQRGAPDG